MIDTYEAVNHDDENGNPAGGSVHGNGLEIIWQNGPLGRGADRKTPNGAFVETVISAVIQRIAYYQAGKFACEPNRIALEYLGAGCGVGSAPAAHGRPRGSRSRRDACGMRNLLLAALNAFVTATNTASRGNTPDPSVEETYVRLANLILSIPDEQQSHLLPPVEALPS